MKKRIIFKNKKQLKKEIENTLDSAENRARARLFNRAKIDKFVKTCFKNPFGNMQDDGGHVANSYGYPAETTYLEVVWYTQSGRKYIDISAYRGSTHSRKDAGEKINTEDKWEAFSHVFPERAKKIEGWLDARKVRTALAGLPPVPTGYQVYKAIREGDIVLTYGGKNRRFIYMVGTPAGWVTVQPHSQDMERSPWLYLRDIGFPIPRLRSNRIWSNEWNADFTAYCTLHALSI